MLFSEQLTSCKESHIAQLTSHTVPNNFFWNKNFNAWLAIDLGSERNDSTTA